MRMKRNFTQQNMADSIGVALRSYQCYETGSRCPSFDVSTDYLLCRDSFLQAHGVFFDESWIYLRGYPIWQNLLFYRRLLYFDNTLDLFPIGLPPAVVSDLFPFLRSVNSFAVLSPPCTNSAPTQINLIIIWLCEDSCAGAEVGHTGFEPVSSATRRVLLPLS